MGIRHKSRRFPVLFFFCLLFSTFCWGSTAGLVVLWKCTSLNWVCWEYIQWQTLNGKCVLYIIKPEVFNYFEPSQYLLYCCVAVFEWLRMLGHCNRKIFIIGLKVAPVLITERHKISLYLTVPAETVYLDFSVFLFRKDREQTEQIIVAVGRDLAPWLLLLWNGRE